jgi:hypothetical protein
MLLLSGFLRYCGVGHGYDDVYIIGNSAEQKVSFIWQTPISGIDWCDVILYSLSHIMERTGRPSLLLREFVQVDVVAVIENVCTQDSE